MRKPITYKTNQTCSFCSGTIGKGKPAIMLSGSNKAHAFCFAHNRIKECQTEIKKAQRLLNESVRIK